MRIRRIDLMGSIEHTVMSSNVSAGGVYFSSEAHLRVGTPVRVYLRMPEQIFGRPVARWCCEGRVIHVHPSGPPGREIGVGLSFQVYTVLTAARLGLTGEVLSLRV